jgi:predicted glycoside hydrolase/deacetylase ChbG (UPF0249 family)
VKQLIVNADDFGVSDLRNAGIVEAHRKGIVTSASILANGQAFPGAVEIARETPTLDIGVHLNLSEGPPLVAGHQTLVREDGLFYGKRDARERAKAGLFRLEEVEAEAAAQIARLKKAGLEITHGDGHHHIHIYGSLPQAIAAAAVRGGIRYLRLPVDAMVPKELADRSRAAQVEEYRRCSLKASEIFTHHGLRSPDFFGGIGLSGILTVETLVAAVRGLPPGSAELMVHPGYAESERGFSGPAREQELKELTHPGLKELLQNEGVRLTRFRDLQDDSGIMLG